MTDKIFNFLINYFSNINDRGVDEMNNFRGDITSDEIVEWLKNIQNTSSEQPSKDFKGEFDDYLVHGDIRNPNFEGPFGYDDIRKTAIHFAQWQKEQDINKACEWLKRCVDVDDEVKMIDDEPEAESFIQKNLHRIEVANQIVKDFKKAMKE